MIQPVEPIIRQLARAMRSNQTGAERILWQALRAKRLHGLKFRRQVPMDRYVVDFFCPDHRLVVEVDGPVHDEGVDYDAKRTAWLEANGYTVLRFTNRQVETETPQVLRAISRRCGATT